MTPLTFVAAAADACAQHLSQNDLNSFQTASKVTTAISIIRLFSVCYDVKALLPEKTRRASSASLAGIYVLGAFVVLSKLGQKPPFQIMNQWFALLSLTTHAAQAILSKACPHAISALFEAYSLYRMAKQPWICVEHEFPKDLYTFKSTYYGPITSQEVPKICSICFEKTQTMTVSDIALTCPPCAKQFYEMKIKEFEFDFREGKAFAKLASLPTCLLTRLPLHNPFSLCIKQNERWQPVDIKWITT